MKSFSSPLYNPTLVGIFTFPAQLHCHYSSVHSSEVTMAIPYPVISVVIWPWQGFFYIFSSEQAVKFHTQNKFSVFFKKIEDVSAVRVVTMCLSRLRSLCAPALRPARPAVRPLTPAPGVHRLSHLDCTEPHGVSRLPLVITQSLPPLYYVDQVSYSLVQITRDFAASAAAAVWCVWRNSSINTAAASIQQDNHD